MSHSKFRYFNDLCVHIIDFLKTASGEFDIWLSNILDYKYTMLKHSITELQLYEHYTKSK
jgi:hypothetical protein